MAQLNLFERATRKKLRFATVKGNLSVEQLWDLPMTGDVSLDSVSQKCHTTLQAFAAASFVDDKPASGAKADAQLAFDVILRVIEVRKADAAAEAKRQGTMEQRRTLEGLLAQKELDALAALTPEQLREKLASLG